jgi:hypothetical protein
MAAIPYHYFTPYQENFQKALNELRQQEFKAGRYYPAMEKAELMKQDTSKGPGAQHESIEDAFEMAEGEGTCSILDLEYISDQPEEAGVYWLPEEILVAQFGSATPTKEQILGDGLAVFDLIEYGGMGVGCVVYGEAGPEELFFAGYSYD